MVYHILTFLSPFDVVYRVSRAAPALQKVCRRYMSDMLRLTANQVKSGRQPKLSPPFDPHKFVELVKASVSDEPPAEEYKRVEVLKRLVALGIAQREGFGFVHRQPNDNRPPLVDIGDSTLSRAALESQIRAFYCEMLARGLLNYNWAFADPAIRRVANLLISNNAEFRTRTCLSRLARHHARLASLSGFRGSRLNQTWSRSEIAASVAGLEPAVLREILRTRAPLPTDTMTNLVFQWATSLVLYRQKFLKPEEHTVFELSLRQPFRGVLSQQRRFHQEACKLGRMLGLPSGAGPQ